jgi:hypothetical protein
MGKVLCEKEIMVDGVPETRLITFTTPAGNQGSYVKVLVPLGHPFWWFATIPAGQVVGCDFTDAPAATADAGTNNALIAAITAQPTDVLTYA